MRRASLHAVALIVGFAVASAEARDVVVPPGSDGAEEDLRDLSLEQLMSTEIVSASRTAERLVEAPATVIVVTREDIEDRGYADLSEILADLPGMDVVRPWGATYMKNYWRGYRNGIGDPFLIMVDGLVFNHLYFNTADVLVTLPLASIQRVEVVYGPASSVYGPNAFMGVVNVITRTADMADGASHVATLSAGSDAGRRVDLASRWRSGDLLVSVAVRFDTGELDDRHADAYAMTRPELYADRRLWGGFVDNPNVAGAFRSRHEHRALQARVELGSLELGFDHLQLESGYGVEYAGDRAQNDAVWSRPDTSVHLRAGSNLGRRVASTTLVRYRWSGVSADSTFLEGFEVPRGGGGTTRVADFSYWQSLNSSWSFFQDLELRGSERWRLAAGLKLEQKDLQKAYDTNFGPTVPVDGLDVSSYDFPVPPVDVPAAPNRITTEDRGAYLQARYEPHDGRTLHLGVRHDRNSQYGASTSVRAGLVSRWGQWTAKALYGEAFQEPTPRQLYGGWMGSGSDPALKPETSRTLEAQASWSGKEHHALVSAYAISNQGTIVNTAAGAQNLGDRNVLGLDLHAQGRRHLGSGLLRVWGFWSHILRADEEVAGGGDTSVGDLARHQLHLGATATRGDWTATLRGRHVGARDTVATNPAGRVPSSRSLDVVLGRRDVLDGLDLQVKVTNVFDALVLHPGVRDANAGMGPGAFEADGSWRGSEGFYSSLLPQPGRAVVFTVRIRRPGGA